MPAKDSNCSELLCARARKKKSRPGNHESCPNFRSDGRRENFKETWTEDLRILEDGVNTVRGSKNADSCSTPCCLLLGFPNVQALKNIPTYLPTYLQSGTSLGAAVASATTIHRKDPSLSTECSRCEKPSACFSVLGVADSSPGRASYPNLAYGPPKWVFVVLWGW